MSNGSKGLLFVVGVAFVLWLILPADKPDGNQRRTAPREEAVNTDLTHVISSGDHYGCVGKAEYDLLMGYVAEGDKGAFTTELAWMVAKGACTVFHGGERVYLEEATLLSGAVRLRRKGDCDLLDGHGNDSLISVISCSGRR